MPKEREDQKGMIAREKKSSSSSVPAYRSVTEILVDLYFALREAFPTNAKLQEKKYVDIMKDEQALREIFREHAVQKLNKEEQIKFSHSEDERIQHLLNFGFESLGSLNLDAKEVKRAIEKRFSIVIKEETLCNDPETQLHVIAKLIQSKGKAPFVPILVDGVEVVEEMVRQQGYDNENMFIKSFRTIGDIILGKRVKKSLSSFFAPSEVLPPKWFQEHQIVAKSTTHFFDNGVGLKKHIMTFWEKTEHAYYSIQIFGVFFYLPISLYLLFMFLSWTSIVIVMSLFILYVYGPDYREYPPLFRRHIGINYNMKFFSYKTIIEAPIPAYENIPSIYTFGPHGIFGIAPSLQALVNGYLVGEHFHVLGASAVFVFPFYNMLLRMLGFEDISRRTFTKLLQKNHSVGIIPGGIGEMFYSGNKVQDEVLMVRNRKGFISIALENGAQIVPTYCFGSTQMFYVGSSKWLKKVSRLLRTSLILFWGKYGLPIPLKVPMVCVLGIPIQCPKVENPTKEMIDYYHTLYLQETQRLYQTYRNSYGWESRNLVYKG